MLNLTGLKIGDVVMLGIPGEPFVSVGRGLKEAEGWSLVIPTCITNEYMGYFPMKDAFDEGGYESLSSSFRSGVAEKLIAEGCQLLRELQKESLADLINKLYAANQNK